MVLYSLHKSIKKVISDYFGDSLYITDKPITKESYNCTLAQDYISTDTIIQLIDLHGNPFETINNVDLTGKSLTLGSERLSRTILSHSGDTVTLESGFGIDVYMNDEVTLNVTNYILIKSIGSGESDKLNNYINIYNRYLLEIGSDNIDDIENIKINLQYLFKDMSYPFVDNSGNPTNSRFYIDDRLLFDTYVDIENNYIEKGFIRFNYQLDRK